MEQVFSQRRDVAWGLALGALLGAASLAASWRAGPWLALALALAALACWIVAGATRWVLAFLAAAILLPPLPLPWGDAGPHPAVLFAALGLWAGVMRLRAWDIRWNPVSAALLLLFASLLLSVPLATLYSGWEVALGSLLRVGLFGVGVHLFFYVAHGPGRDLTLDRLVRLLFWVGLCSAAFACLDFYFQFPAVGRLAEQFVWLPNAVLRRAQGVFYEANTFGSFCTFLLVMIATIATLKLAGDFRLPRLLLALSALVLAAGLAFSYSRSATGSLVVALAALVWLERERFRSALRFVGWALMALAGLAGCSAIVNQLFPDFLSIYFLRLWYTGQFLISEPELILAPRLEGWRFLWRGMAASPWHTIFGIGYKTLPYSDFLGRPVIADSQYLSQLVETGWLGLAALLFLNAAILIATYRLAHDSGPRRFIGVWMFCFWCGQSLQMLLVDTLTYWRLLPLYFAVLAVGLRKP